MTGQAARRRETAARAALARVASAAVLVNATWFSATAIVPALERDWALTGAGAAWPVVVVQVGFVVGSLAAAVSNLPDRVEPRRLIAPLLCWRRWRSSGLVRERSGGRVAEPVRRRRGARGDLRAGGA